MVVKLGEEVVIKVKSVNRLGLNGSQCGGFV